jgi:hypothetical protein
MPIRLPNGWVPRPYQRPLWDYLERGGRHAEAVWHRRSGKDEVALHRAACAAFERQANYWHMLPEYAQARKAIWDSVNPHTGKRRIDEAFPHEIRKTTRNQEMQIEFINGSTWQVVGSDSFNTLVGSAPAGVVWSEWALANPSAPAYIEPILEENGGWQLYITTPRGRNHAYRSLKAAERSAGDFAQILTAQQTGIFSPEQLEAIRQRNIDRYGEDIGTSKFEQEYLCSFDAANLGTILARTLGKLEQIGRIGPHVEYDPEGAPIEISADLGRRDSATWWFWQPRIGGFAIVDYDGGWGLDADEWCDRLEAKLEGRRLGTIWLPHDARQKTFAAKRSALEIFVSRFGAKHVDLTPQSSIADRVNAARVLINRCEFSDRCERGIDGLRAWSYEYNEETKIFGQVPKHDWASHDGDGYSYGCLIMQQTRPVVVPAPIVPRGPVTVGQFISMAERGRRGSARI